ncbi:MAG: SusC/RagA family TonB-linked outer membrane protein [Tannerella sp.]|jgi:TonB-linked SusC/RagA family outer membrane protein|nr:SusC/RagA family TonB-linked outer membrane protein [Tannerella sp.]
MLKTIEKKGIILMTAALCFAGNMRADVTPVRHDADVSQQSGKVTGTVSDDLGSVAGASVIVKGTTNGVMTDANGQFSLDGVKNGDVIQISFLGYITQEITYTGQRSLSVTLVEDALALDEVVVTAMGITKEAKKLGYAITTINAGELTKAGATNFASALYGKASGVRIQSVQGGAASGVSINVRGLSSLEGNTQPLVILNGVPIRNGNVGDDKKDFGTIGNNSNRVRSNGLVDINPEDIESLSILKGAAATALYGSEAANGAIIITSKKAKGKGLSIDVNATLQSNMVAYVPKIQTEYGPGSATGSLNEYQKANGRFTSYINPDDGQVYSIPDYSSQGSWGPKFDGQQVLYWDGKMRAYSPISKDPWKELFRTGYDQIYNIAINHGGDNSSTRFSYTFMDEVPNIQSGSYSKHNINVVGNLKFNDRLSLDYTGNFISQQFHNRAINSINLYSSWSNMFQAFMDVPLMEQKYQTSLGYKNNDRGVGLTPDEAFKVPAEGQVNGLRNLFWDIYHHNNDETSTRFLGSFAPVWKITDYLTARGRVSTDFTFDKYENREDSEFPSSASQTESSGSYSTTSKYYSIVYGDALLMFDKKLTDEIGLTASAGWQGRTEKMNVVSLGTNGGLAVENVFTLTNSYRNVEMNEDRERKMELLKTAYLGTLGVSYGDYLFLDGTARSEKSSTLPKNSRSYFYPSGSASFLFSEAFADALPSWLGYGKMRVSYGIVGNAPEAYAANFAYTMGSAPGWTYNQIPDKLGNAALKPEKTKEFEIGLESKLFNNRLGFEVSYYNRDITDMLVPLNLPPSSGAGSIWLNAGAMTNKGVEVSLYGTPVQTRDFALELRSNLGFNRNQVNALVEGVEFLEAANYSGGLGMVRSYVGSTMGDFVTYVMKTTPDGRPIVNAEGYYEMKSDPEVVANAMPKMVGGLGASLSYRDFSLDIMTDFRVGGYVYNECYQYTMTLGIAPETGNREGEGFYKYTTPDGKYTAQNGIILDGVVFDEKSGSYVKNEKVIAYDDYIGRTYNWGGGGTPCSTISYSLKENNYWKVREVQFGYSLPKSLIQNTALKNLTVSVFGRNLFYFYKSIPNYDPETSTGTSWKSQLIIGGSASPTRNIGVSLRASF